MLQEPAIVNGMAALRLFSAALEVTAALLMLRLGRVDTAVQINALLGLVGPAILLAVMALGLVGLAGKVAPGKLFLIGAGVALIFLGVKR